MDMNHNSTVEMVTCDECGKQYGARCSGCDAEFDCSCVPDKGAEAIKAIDLVQAGLKELLARHRLGTTSCSKEFEEDLIALMKNAEYPIVD